MFLRLAPQGFQKRPAELSFGLPLAFLGLPLPSFWASVWHQIVLPIGPKGSHWASKGSQRVPKALPRGCKRLPGVCHGFPEGFLAVFKGPSRLPRGSQNVSKGFQKVPKGFQGASKWSQGASKVVVQRWFLFTLLFGVSRWSNLMLNTFDRFWRGQRPRQRPRPAWVRWMSKYSSLMGRPKVCFQSFQAVEVEYRIQG